MKNREPFGLRSLMLVYNAGQVFSNMWLVRLGLEAIWLGAYEPNPYLCLISDARTLWCGRLYVLNKYVDLTDTVLFVLRKKRSQITFLHLFHHVVMVAWPSTTLHLPIDAESMVAGIVNCVVHVIMYSYYFACIYGHDLRAVTVFVKRHVTRIQLVQFVMLLFIYVRGAFGLCHYAPWFSMFGFVLNVVFFGLFLQMYFRFYRKPAVVP